MSEEEVRMSGLKECCVRTAKRYETIGFPGEVMHLVLIKCDECGSTLRRHLGKWEEDISSVNEMSEGEVSGEEKALSGGRLARIITDVLDERKKNYERWGIQNYPSFDQVLLTRPGGCTVQRMCEEYEIPIPDRAKSKTMSADQKGQCTWAHVLIEELCEVVGECNTEDGNPSLLYGELKQVAAVTIAWMDYLLRERGLSSEFGLE